MKYGDHLREPVKQAIDAAWSDLQARVREACWGNGVSGDYMEKALSRVYEAAYLSNSATRRTSRDDGSYR